MGEHGDPTLVLSLQRLKWFSVVPDGLVKVRCLARAFHAYHAYHEWVQQASKLALLQMHLHMRWARWWPGMGGQHSSGCWVHSIVMGAGPQSTSRQPMQASVSASVRACCSCCRLQAVPGQVRHHNTKL